MPEKKSPAEKREVKDAFSAIARRYDLMNTLCSLGIERNWRRHAVAALDLKKNTRVLDLCAGTLTVSADVAKAAGGVRVAALDFCPEMLQAGVRRRKRHELDWIDPVCGEGERIPFRSGVFDGAIATYGVRNLADPEAGICEIYRVLKPGARFVILEFTRPESPLFAPLYGFYLGRVMPLIGALVTGSWNAYDYLSRSVRTFMEPERLMGLLAAAGFGPARVEHRTLGIVGIYTAAKPQIGY